MSQFTIALCFFIAILAMAGTVLVLTIIYFFRQTSNRARTAASAGGQTNSNEAPLNTKSGTPPAKPAQPGRKRRFFWNRTRKTVKEEREKVIPPVITAALTASAKSLLPKTPQLAKPAVQKISFWRRLRSRGRKPSGQAKPPVHTTVYDSAVVAASVSTVTGAPPAAANVDVPAKPVSAARVAPVPGPAAPTAAAAAPKFALPKKPVPPADAGISLPPVNMKNLMPGTPVKSEVKAAPPASPPPAPAVVKPAAGAVGSGVDDKKKVELAKPVAKENKPEMGKQDNKQPEKPAAEKTPAPPTPAPAEVKKANDLSVLGDLSKMFAKEVVDDSEATKLAKNMKDVEINDLLKNGHDIANLLKRH